jgi:HlyD family secretion protein
MMTDRTYTIKHSPALGVALTLIGLAALLPGCGQGDGRLGASGTVEATEARLGFMAVGRVESIDVQEGDEVRKGQTLAALDRTETLARRTQAQAQVAAAQALLDEMLRGSRPEEIAQGESAQKAANDRLEDADRDLKRARTLFDGGAISREALDKTETAYEVAKSQASQAADALELLRKGPREERIAAQRAQLAQAQAALAALDATLDHMVIEAPFDGIISVRHREPGETVPMGAPVLTLSNRSDRWIRIYVPEDRIGAVRVGSAATITCDTYPGKSYRGEVTFIASEAEFTPKSVQTAEERVKLVYAVKVRVLDDPSYDLKIGVPADVVLEPVS